MRAIEMHQTGGPEVLEWSEVPDPRPGEGEVVVRVAAAGVNFIDTYHREGLYPVPLPFVPGMEGAGTVTDVGVGVDGIRPGDRVAWAFSGGSYAQLVRLPAAKAVPVPEEVDLEVAAAAMLQGLTAHYLVTDTYPLAQGHRCLIHAGAGGVGLLLTQIAKRIGAEVFTTVGTSAKGDLSRAAGADHVIDYRSEDFRSKIEKIAGERPLDVVFDGVGATVFDDSLALLKPRGMMVTFGNASGPVPPVSPLLLMTSGSLFLTRPTLGHYIATRDELTRRSGELFEWILDGLDVRIHERVPLAEAARAQEMLTGRLTSGKVILVP